MVNDIKVFKKTSPNGQVTAYLSRRDFVDHLTHTAPIDGVIVVDDEYLRGRKVFGSVVITFRYGREEDEVMGLHFSKEYEVFNAEITPKEEGAELSNLQTRMIEKVGANARPFAVTLPKAAPTSVSLEPGDDSEKPLGVLYDLKFFVADTGDDQPHRRNSVSFAVRKVQYAPSHHDNSRPYSVVNRSFTLSPGKLNLEIGLNQDIYFHGQPVETVLKVHNASKRTVKGISAQVIQHIEVTMTNTYFSRIVASINSHEGCPITPDTKFERTFDLAPRPYHFKRTGIALDGKVKDEDSNLASSTIVGTGENVEDALGIVVSYSVEVKLHCGAISGELSAEVPFKLMHPDPETEESKPEANLEIREFSSFRRGKSVDDGLED